jgi:hypothetical protein
MLLSFIHELIKNTLLNVNWCVSKILRKRGEVVLQINNVGWSQNSKLYSLDITKRSVGITSVCHFDKLNKTQQNIISYKRERNTSSVCYFTTFPKTIWLPYPGRKLKFTANFAAFIYNSLITTGSTI